MPGRQSYELLFAPEVVDHLAAIDSKHHSSIARAIEQQLRYAPDDETRNKKPLQDTGPSDSTWELRCGHQNQFRVFYDVRTEDAEVHILAIGVKIRNKLFISGEEYSP